MSRSKSNIETDNKLLNSSVWAGKNVQIGNIYHINNPRGNYGKSAKGTSFVKYLVIVLLSVILVSVTIKECVLEKSEKKGTFQGYSNEEKS